MEDTDEQIGSVENGERGLDEAANVRYLEPDELSFRRTEGGFLQLTIENDRTVLWVKARRCFPFALPGTFISLRDGADKEIGIVRDLSALRATERAWIEDELQLRYFMPRVRAIQSMRPRYGGTQWTVDTDRGERRFVTKGMSDAVAEMAPGRLIISDVEGNRYEMLADAMDEASRKMMDRLI